MMQKVIHTLDGQTIYVNIEPVYDYEKHRWMTIEEMHEQYPFPSWRVIHDMKEPIAEAGIHLQGDKIILGAAGKDFPIDGKTFLELIDETVGIHLKNGIKGEYVYSQEEVGKIYAKLLCLLWESREKALGRDDIEDVVDDDDYVLKPRTQEEYEGLKAFIQEFGRKE